MKLSTYFEEMELGELKDLSIELKQILDKRLIAQYQLKKNWDIDGILLKIKENRR